MRRAWVLAFALLSACGDDDGTTPAVDSPPAPDGRADGPGADGPAADSAPAADASIGPSCGGETCDPDDEKCCTTAGDGGLASTCVAAAASCGGVSATCDGPEDCDGDDCCFAAEATSCEATCAGVVVCHADGDCATGKCCPNAAGEFSSCLPVATCPGP